MAIMCRDDLGSNLAAQASHTSAAVDAAVDTYSVSAAGIRRRLRAAVDRDLHIASVGARA